MSEDKKEKSLASEELEFWLGMGKSMIGDSIKTIDDAARQLIGAVGLLEGLYFHAIAYSGLAGQVEGVQMGIYLLPVMLLIGSLIAALFVFLPDYFQNVPLNSAAGIKAVRRHVLSRKLKALFISAVCFVLALLGLLAAMWLYLGG